MVAGEARDGGDGPDVDGEGVPMVPADGDVDGGVRHDEAKMMARRRARIRPGAAAWGDRSCSGGRQPPVEDRDVEWLQGKIAEEVREVRKGMVRIMGKEWAAGAHYGGRKWRWTAAVRRSSGGKILRPGGDIRTRGRGEMRRGSRATYRSRRGRESQP